MFLLATSLLVAGLPSLATGSSGDTYSGPAVQYNEIQAISTADWAPTDVTMDNGWMAIGDKYANRVQLYELGEDGWGLHTH